MNELKMNDAGFDYGDVLMNNKQLCKGTELYFRDFAEESYAKDLATNICLDEILKNCENEGCYTMELKPVVSPIIFDDYFNDCYLSHIYRPIEIKPSNKELVTHIEFEILEMPLDKNPFNIKIKINDAYCQLM